MNITRDKNESTWSQDELGEEQKNTKQERTRKRTMSVNRKNLNKTKVVFTSGVGK